MKSILIIKQKIQDIYFKIKNIIEDYNLEQDIIKYNEYIQLQKEYNQLQDELHRLEIRTDELLEQFVHKQVLHHHKPVLDEDGMPTYDSEGNPILEETSTTFDWVTRSKPPMGFMGQAILQLKREFSRHDGGYEYREQGENTHNGRDDA